MKNRLKRIFYHGEPGGLNGGTPSLFLPSDNGIFTKRSILNLAFIFLIGVSLFSCNGKHEHSQEQIAKEKSTYTCPMHPQVIQDNPGTCPICKMDLVKVNMASSESGEIMLSQSQMKLGNITTRKVKFETMGNTTILTGTLKANEEAVEIISSRVVGRVEKLYLKEVGQMIRENQPLYEIYSEPLLVLQREYLLAHQQYNELGKQERYLSFLKAAEKKLLLLGMTHEQLQQLAKDKKVEARITFLAPASGIVSEINVREGQYVAEGEKLYKIENLDKIWIEAQLYPGEVSLAKQEETVKVVVNGYENQSVDGKIVFLSPEYGNGTQIISMRVEILNKEKKFFPGMQANVVLTNSTKKTIALPTDAVIRDQQGKHIWIESEEGVFESRMVETGLENFDKVEITEGLHENETVVVSGAYLLYSEYVLKKGGTPIAGHNH
ncbi:MAG TPA: efflux RND transporter periplasmic adaptor subunit [Cytophagales bacterium]|nr:efflux RND transporter periplasmic adaptor subunit [Cytophagales bacterium]